MVVPLPLAAAVYPCPRAAAVTVQVVASTFRKFLSINLVLFVSDYIEREMRHLLPYRRSILLQRRRKLEKENTGCAKSRSFPVAPECQKEQDKNVYFSPALETSSIRGTCCLSSFQQFVQLLVLLSFLFVNRYSRNKPTEEERCRRSAVKQIQLNKNN